MMALQPGALRDALIEAGASAHTASDAAEAVAGYENRLSGIEARIADVLGELKVQRALIGVLMAMAVAILVRVLLH